MLPPETDDPALSATIFDSREALKAARECIAAAHMGERIAVQEGDFLHDTLPTGYDVALIFNIVHGFSPEQNTDLLRKVAAALNPGGLVVIAEQLAGKAPGPMLQAAAQILGLAYFHLLDGQIYAFDDIAGWLGAAGFANPRRINLLKAPGNSLVLATKGG